MNATCYAIFAATVVCQLWIFFREPRLVLLKVITSTILVAMIALLAAAFTSWLGWPAETPTYGRFQVVKVIIINGVPGQRGRIYAWMIPQETDTSRNPFVYASAAENAPRAFAISTNYEKTMNKAEAALENGSGVFISFGENGGVEGKAKPNRDRQELNDDDPAAPKIEIIEPEKLMHKGD